MLSLEDKFLQRLQELVMRGDDFSRVAEFYQQVAPLQVEAKSRLELKRPPTSSAIKKKLEADKAQVTFEGLAIDWLVVRDLFSRMLHLLADYKIVDDAQLGKLKELAPDPALLKRAARKWYKQPVVECSNSVEVAIAIALRLTFLPCLVKHSEAIMSMFDQERWRRSSCPICGGKADFAFLNKENGARWLVCWRCDTQWLFQRLVCPYCGNDDQKSLAYFTDDNNLYRLYVCDVCHSYLKCIDLRQTEEEILFPLERILTVGQDSQIQEKGYKPGWIASTPDR